MMATIDLDDILNNADDAHPEPICVVKLRTSMWSDKRGMYAKKSLTFIRRRCVGENIVEEDVSMGGVEAVLPRILNLSTSPDGVYRIRVCNVSYNWETGHVDDYDYCLVPEEK